VETWLNFVELETKALFVVLFTLIVTFKCHHNLVNDFHCNLINSNYIPYIPLLLYASTLCDHCYYWLVLVYCTSSSSTCIIVFCYCFLIYVLLSRRLFSYSFGYKCV